MSRVLPLLASLLLSCGGCASIQGELQAARDAALADPGPAPATWQPDAVLQLSGELVDRVVEVAIEEQGPLKTSLDLGLAKVTPELEIRALSVRGGRDCSDCLALDFELDGAVDFATPIGRGSAPLAAEGTLDAVFGLAPDEGVWTVTVQPKRVRRVKVTVGRTSAALSGLDDRVRTWIDENLVAKVEPQTVASLGSSELPLRAARVVPEAKGVRLELLTASPTPGTATAPAAAPAHGWRLTLSQDSLLDLARAEAFRHGEVAYDILPEPTSFSLEGGRFTLGLRLWKTSGRGWWRDYLVRGDVSLAKAGIELVPIEVDDVGHSKGAALADPLAALGQGVILKTLEQAVETTLPAKRQDRAGDLRTTVRLTELGDSGDDLALSGTLNVRASKRRR